MEFPGSLDQHFACHVLFRCKGDKAERQRGTHLSPADASKTGSNFGASASRVPPTAVFTFVVHFIGSFFIIRWRSIGRTANAKAHRERPQRAFSDFAEPQHGRAAVARFVGLRLTYCLPLV
jgi:hypothetical protein